MNPIKNISGLILDWVNTGTDMYTYLVPVNYSVFHDVPPTMLYSVVAGIVAGTLVLVVFLCRTRSRDQCDIESMDKSVLNRIHHYAGNPFSISRYQQCVELLTKYPHFVNMTMPADFHISHGYTPFLRACWNNNYDLIKFMLSIGADLNLTNADGETAMYLVAYRVSKSEKWDPQALILLYKQGCSVNEINCNKNTMLHMAAKAGNIPLTRWLLVHGANHNVVNNANYTPRKLALLKGTSEHQIVAQLLNDDSEDGQPREVRIQETGIEISPLDRSNTDSEGDSDELQDTPTTQPLHFSQN